MRRRDTRGKVLEWLRDNDDSTPFNIVNFCDQNVQGKEERDYVSGYFRKMKKTVELKYKEIESFSREISSIPIEETELKRTLEERFTLVGCPWSDWIKFTDEQKFEKAKEFMKAYNIYYRIRSKINSEEWIVPIYEQRVEKLKESIYSRVNSALRAFTENVGILITDDTKNKTRGECVGEIRELQPMIENVKSLGDSLSKRLNNLTNRIIDTDGFYLSVGERDTDFKGPRNG